MYSKYRKLFIISHTQLIIINIFKTLTEIISIVNICAFYNIIFDNLEESYINENENSIILKSSFTTSF